MATLSSAAAAQEPGRIEYEAYRLDNGLEVILSPKGPAQLVAINLTYDVGSAHEPPRRTGLNHLLEHLMFLGSERVERPADLVRGAGGFANAYTGDNSTTYITVLPSNQLRLGLWIEADRMRSLRITEQALSNAKATVTEERLGEANSPYGGLARYEIRALYDSTGCFPYAHGRGGAAEDIAAVTVEDAVAFYDRFYWPAAARLVVVGEFDPGEARAAIRDYFGALPAGEEPPGVVCAPGYRAGLLTLRYPEPRAPVAVTVVGYRVPPSHHPDLRPLRLLSTILRDRLQQVLVRERGVARNAGSGVDDFAVGGRWGPAILRVAAVGVPGVTADSLADYLEEEVRSVVEGGVDAADLHRAKELYRRDTISDRETAEDVADGLQQAAAWGDVDRVNTEFAAMMAITEAELARVASEYLRRDNALIILGIPGGAP